MYNVPNGVKTLPKIPNVWVGCNNVTDDRQTTDGRTTTYSERERECTLAKNELYTVETEHFFLSESLKITKKTGWPKNWTILEVHNSFAKDLEELLIVGDRIFNVNFITALHVMQTRYSEENSLRPSACPSVCHTRVLWQNGRKICPDFYTIRKNIYPSFLRRRMVGGGRPLLPEILGQPTPVRAKSPIFNQ